MHKSYVTPAELRSLLLIIYYDVPLFVIKTWDVGLRHSVERWASNEIDRESRTFPCGPRAKAVPLLAYFDQRIASFKRPISAVRNVQIERENWAGGFYARYGNSRR